MPSLSNTADFLIKALSLHGDKFDYSKVAYKTAGDKVIIVCREHGDFLQAPNKHLCGQGCYQCGRAATVVKQRSSTLDYVGKARSVHGDTYDYSHLKYVNSQTKVIITCSIHGDFSQMPTSHLAGVGCDPCGRIRTDSKRRKSLDQFLAKSAAAHGNRYSYGNVDYKGTNYKVQITCKIHGDFAQMPYKHYAGQGCPMCMNHRSEEFCRTALNEIFGKPFVKSRPDFLGRMLELDGYCTELNMAFEYQGAQHYKLVPYWHRTEDALHAQQERDAKKRHLCKLNGVALLEIPYTYSIEKPDKLFEYIVELVIEHQANQQTLTDVNPDPPIATGSTLLDQSTVTAN